MEMNLFDIILDIERSKSKFLDTRNLRSQSLGLSEMWSQVVEFSILDNLIHIAKITNLLFKRFEDEFQKNKENEEGDNEEILDFLRQNIILTLKLQILIHVHIQYLEDVGKDLDYAKISQSAIIMEDIYQSIHNFFLTTPELGSNSKLTSLIQLIEKHHSTERIQSNITKFHVKQHQKLLEANIAKGRVYLKYLTDVINSPDDEFWYRDYILAGYLNSKVIDLFEPLLNLDTEVDFALKSDIEKIRLIDLPVAKAQADLATATVLIQIAKKRINSFELELGLIELKSAKHKLDKVFNHLGMHPSSNSMKSLYRETEQLSDEANLISLLVEINLMVEQLLNACEENDRQKVMELVQSIDNELISHDYNLDIEYLSAFPPLYDNIVVTLKMVLENKDDLDIIRTRINHNFENMERRLITATTQIVESFDSISDDNKQKTLNKITILNEQVNILQLANSLLPTHIPSKNHNHNRLQILQELSQSLYFELQAYFVTETNKLQELMYKTRAYHHANNAYFEFNNLGTTDVPIDRIKAHYSGSFISANRQQIDLYQSISQYLCLNDILPTFYLVISFDKDLTEDDAERVYHSWVKRFERIELFKNLMDQIARSSKILQEHKQIHGSIVSGINWEQIELIESQSKGVTQFLRAIKELLLGTVCLKLGLKEDAIIHFTESKSLGYNAAETLNVLNSLPSEISEAPVHVFNFAKFAQESAASPSSHDLMALPVTGALKLLRDLVFSM